jgi:hypothetical protein
VRRAGAALAISIALGVPAQGQEIGERERAAARDLGREGLALFDQGDFAGALERLERAHRLVRLATTGLYSARCLERLGRLVEASERYYEVVRMDVPADAMDVQRQAQTEAAREREALLPRIPKVTLRIQNAPPGTRTVLDGKPLAAALFGVAQPIDPGEHHLVCSEGETTLGETRFAVREGETREVVLELPAREVAAPVAPVAPVVPVPPAATAAPPPPQPESAEGGGTLRALGWIAIGVGAAGVLTGAVAGGLAARKRDDLEEGCGDDGGCPPPLHEDVDAYDTLRAVSSVGFIAGGVLAAGGVAMVLLAPSGDGAASAPGPRWGGRVAPAEGGAWIGLDGRF